MKKVKKFLLFFILPLFAFNLFATPAFAYTNTFSLTSVENKGDHYEVKFDTSTFTGATYSGGSCVIVDLSSIGYALPCTIVSGANTIETNNAYVSASGGTRTMDIRIDSQDWYLDYTLDSNGNYNIVSPTPTPTATPTPTPTIAPTITPSPTIPPVTQASISALSINLVKGAKNGTIQALVNVISSGIPVLLSIIVIYFVIRHFMGMSGLGGGENNHDSDHLFISDNPNWKDDKADNFYTYEGGEKVGVSQEDLDYRAAHGEKGYIESVEKDE